MINKVQGLRLGGLDLGVLWRTAIRDGLLAARSILADGTHVHYGLTLGPAGRIESFAVNEDTGHFLKTLEEKQDGLFTIRFDRVRGLRPGTHIGRTPGPQPELDPEAPDWRLARQRSFGTVSSEGISWQVHYNIAPIVKEGHFLLTPVTQAGAVTSEPQRLTERILKSILALAMHKSHGLIWYFNSVHAGASIDRLHVQCVARAGVPTSLIDSPRNTSEGLVFAEYPATVLVFDLRIDAERLITSVLTLTEKRIPFNFLLTETEGFLIPRNANEEVVHGGVKRAVFGGSDFSGLILLETEEEFQHATAEHLVSDFGRATLSVQDVILAIS